MLVKVKDGTPTSLFHEGVKYHFAKGQPKECPESILMAYRGLLIPVQKPVVVPPKAPERMPIIQIEQLTKIKIPIKVKSIKKKKNK
jgi:hypothetical protein